MAVTARGLHAFLKAQRSEAWRSRAELLYSRTFSCRRSVFLTWPSQKFSAGPAVDGARIAALSGAFVAPEGLRSEGQGGG